MVKYNAVIVGCGQIAGGYDEKKKDNGTYTHAGAYKKNDVKIIAVAEVNKQRVNEFSNFWKVPNVYSDYKEMLKNEKADIVSICLPDNFHEEAVLFAARNSPAKIIFCEKPLSTNSRSAKLMLKVCKKAGKFLIVNNQRRWEPFHEKARKMIEEGKIGNIQGITGYYVKGLLHIGSTMINTVRFLAGDPKKSYMNGKDIVLEYSSGFKAFIMTADKNGYGHSAFDLDIMGDKGRIRFSENSNILEIFVSEDYKKYPGMGFKMLYLKERKETHMGSAIENGIKEMIEILAGKKSSSFNAAEEAIKDLEIIEEITSRGGK